MLARAIGTLALLLSPAAALYLSGHSAPAHYFALGTVLAVRMSVLARPVAAFSVVLPVAYAAASVTALATGGVAALIVAIAAVVGAASSQGLQRGLLAVLAATVIGASEPASGSAVVAPTLAMLAGSSYGFVLTLSALRDVVVDTRAVHGQTALGFAVLLAVLVLVAWLAAQALDVVHGWWIPLAVATVGHPALTGSMRRSLAQLMGTMLGTLLLVAATELADAAAERGALLIVLGFILLAAGRTRQWLRALLFTPILVLLASHAGSHPPTLESLQSAFLACAAVFGVALLGQWLLWTLRPDPGHAPA